jgi:tetratricopeptide (TPR) repeat protein
MSKPAGKRVKVGNRPGDRHGATARYATQTWHRAAYVTAFISSFGGLLVLSWLVGHGARKLHLGDVIGHIVATMIHPAVATPIALMLVVVLAWSFRNAIFEFRGWLPSPVQVTDFKLTFEDADLDAAWLTGVFRARLAHLNLQAPNPVPGTAPAGRILDVLAQSSTDVSSPTLLFRILGAAVPSHAYEVEGLIVRGSDAEKPAGISVTVTRLADAGSSAFTAWGRTHAEAAERAGDGATAVVLPHTRLCRRQWIGWRNHVLPADLLRDYEEGLELELHNELDRALACYHRVLEADPFNLAVRLQIGQVHEQKQRPMEALASYQSIITVTLPAGEQLPRGLYSWSARKERSGVIAVANYRRAILFAGTQLASEWLGSEPANTDPERLAYLRGHLRPVIEQLANDFVGAGARRSARSAGPRFEQTDDVREALGDDDFGTVLMGRDANRLLILFAALGLAATQELERAASRTARFAAFIDRRPPDRPYTRLALRLSVRCMRLRLAYALAHAGQESVLRRELESLDDGIWEAIGSWFGVRHTVKQWHEAYLAACAYGIAHSYRQQGRTWGVDAAELADQSVDWLERATACADSAFVATRRRWMVDEDPDLASVRGTDRFVLWKNVYFPNMDPPKAAEPAS